MKPRSERHTRLSHAIPAGSGRLFLSGLTVLLFSSACRHHSHPIFDLLTVLEGDAGPVYIFTDPDRGSSDPFAVRNMIIHEMNEARTSIDFWFYGFDDPALARALLHAKNRGVRLNLTGSPDQDYRELRTVGLSPIIRAKSGIQHAKLLIVDRRILISGTGNFTRSCMFYNDNVFFRTSINGATADSIIQTMIKEDQFHPPIEWHDGLARFRFVASPQNGRTIQSAIVQSILDARTSVRFLIFSFTDASIAGALLEKARDGVLTEGVFESYGGSRAEPGSVLDLMNRQAGFAPLFLYADGNNHIYYDQDDVVHGGKLHHKTMIVDDRIILTGSFNWTASARDSNLETFFEIEDPFAPNIFLAAFNRIQAKGSIVARPPYDPVPAPPINAPVSPCPSDMPFDRILFRSGRGAFFRGLVFTPQSCPSPNADSAGFQTSDLFSPGIPQSGELLVDFRPGRFTATESPPESPVGLPVAFFCANRACDPCVQQSCRPLALKRISFQEGWGLVNGGTLSYSGERELWIWHRNGIEKSRAQMIDGELLLFERPPEAISGAILFLRGEDGTLQVGCAFTDPPPAPRAFLNALPWFYPAQFPAGVPCVSPD